MATDLSELDQLTVLSVASEGLTVAVKVSVPPTSSAMEISLSEIWVTAIVEEPPPECPPPPEFPPPPDGPGSSAGPQDARKETIKTAATAAKRVVNNFLI